MKILLAGLLVAQIAAPFRLPIPGLYPTEAIKFPQFFNKDWLFLEKAGFSVKKVTQGYIEWMHKDKSVVWIEKANGRLIKIGHVKKNRVPATRYCVNTQRFLISPDHPQEYISFE